MKKLLSILSFLILVAEVQAQYEGYFSNRRTITGARLLNRAGYTAKILAISSVAY
jgi:hypothetical protein